MLTVASSFLSASMVARTVAVHHVALRGNVYVLRTLFRGQGAEFPLIVGALEESFLELRIVRQRAVQQLVVKVVRVVNVLRHVYFSLLALQLIVGGGVDGVEGVDGVRLVDGGRQLHVVALVCGNVARSGLGGGDGVEAVKQVLRGVALGVAPGVPDGHVELAAKFAGHKHQNVLVHVHRLERLTLGHKRAVDGAPHIVGVEAVGTVAKEKFKFARGDGKVAVVRACALVRAKFGIAVKLAEHHVAKQAGHARHVLERGTGRCGRHDEEILLVAGGTLFQCLEGGDSFSHCVEFRSLRVKS